MKSIHHGLLTVNLSALSSGDSADYHCSMDTQSTEARVFIGGPPFSGKTAAGVILALQLGVPFVDLDRVIESAAGMSVPDIFVRLGEEAFRDLETQALMEVAARNGGFVAALGGGCLLRPGNLEAAMASGVLLMLTAGDDELMSRARLQEGSRPLVKDVTSLKTLLASRRGHYASLPAPIDTTGLAPEETAGRLLEKLRRSDA
ncbi:MAG: hypothetical protein AVO35_12175 [Candidatus Aegiribacteria sp. MLS_C]|nr:MAG: hypothetical protein AVO35_12175 [Candidatus Aegiribacteria sp. MLS_C]